MSLEAARGLYTHPITDHPVCLDTHCASEILQRGQQAHLTGFDPVWIVTNFRDLNRSIFLLCTYKIDILIMRRCRIWSCKLAVSCILGIFDGFLRLPWLSDHMELKIIYLIMHIHVGAGFRPLSPVQRKYVKASCPGMELITKPSTKGIVLWGDQPSSEPMPWRAVIWRPRSFYRESQYWARSSCTG